MLERLTNRLLSRLLSKYFVIPDDNINTSYSTFSNLHLQTSHLNTLLQRQGLPLQIIEGNITSISIDVPWGRLRSLLQEKGEKMTCTLQGVQLVLGTRYEFDDDKLREFRWRERREELESVANYFRGEMNNDDGSGSYLSSSAWIQWVKRRLVSESWNEVVDGIVGGMEIRIKDVEVKVIEGGLGRPFCVGLKLERLDLLTEVDSATAVAVDDDDLNNHDDGVGSRSHSPMKTSKSKKKGKKQKSNPKKILPRKVLEMGQFSIYCDSLSTSSSRHQDTQRHPKQQHHTYLLQPLNSTTLLTLTKSPQNTLHTQTTLTNFQLNLSSPTISHLTTLHARISHHKSLLRHRYHRPAVSISTNPKLWWKYLIRVIRKELRNGYCRGGWSWIRWYERREVRRRYGELYGRWLECGVEEDGVVAGGEGEEDSLNLDNADSPSTGALTILEYEELRAIEDGTVDDELTVNDILLFRAMVHSKRQKQDTASSADHSATTNAVDSQYRLTRFLKRMITSEEDVDEEYTKLLSYLEKKEEESARRLQEEEREKKLKEVRNSSELAVVVSMETVICRGSVSLLSDRGCIFEAALKRLQTKFSIFEGFECVIVEASIHDCLGLEHPENGLANVVFSRYNVCRMRDETCKRIDVSDEECDADILLSMDLVGKEDNLTDPLPWSHYDSPLLNICFTINPPGDYNASLLLVLEKTQMAFNSGFDWPRQCKDVFSMDSQPREGLMSTDQAFWEDLSIAYINSWESTKKSLAAKAEKALEKPRKLDVDVTVYSPVVQISDGIETTLSMDFGRAIVSTEQLAGAVKRENDHHEDVTPKKRNTTISLLPRKTQYPSSSDDSLDNLRKGYLFTPNKRPSTFSAPDPLSESQASLDISNIFGTPNDTFSLNGSFSAMSFDSSQKRRRGYSIGNSKLFSVAEDVEAAAVDIEESELKLMKCFYDYYQLRLDAVNVFISTSTTRTNVFELPMCEARIAKSTIPSDANLCRIRVSCAIDYVQMNMSKESIAGLSLINYSMKRDPVENYTMKNYSGSKIFPTLQLPVHETDDESSVNEDEFLDAISEFQPDDAGQWFDQQWVADDESIGTFTYTSLAQTPSRRHRFPSISEVSADEENKVYLSAENLLKLDESLEVKHQRLRSYSQMSGGEEDSFHSAISLDNHGELVQAIQDDIKKCEYDIGLTKEQIKNAALVYTEHWQQNGKENDINRRRYHKQKLKTQLLRLEAELNALNSCYREIITIYAVKTEPNEQSEFIDEELRLDTQVLHRAKALITARQYRETNTSTLSPTKISRQGHHTLTKQNRDLLFTSATVSSFALNVTAMDRSSPNDLDEQECVRFVCNQLTLSFHRRQIDQRIRFGVKDAFVNSSRCGKFIQCGHLDENAFAGRVREVQNEGFLRIAAEVRKHSKPKSERRPLSKVKLKLNFGPVEIDAQSMVDALKNLQSLQVEPKPSQITQQYQIKKSDPMEKLVGLLMGSTELSSGQQSHDIDLRFNSLDILLASDGVASLFTITGMNIRLARRCYPHSLPKPRGQLDFRIINVQLHDVSWGDHPRELLGCRSSFERFMQGRIRVELSKKNLAGGWCIGIDSSNTEDESKKLNANLSPTNESNPPLCWNIHVGIKCQSNLVLVLSSPEIIRIIGSSNDILSSFKSMKKTKIERPSTIEESSCDVYKAIPVRSRIDFSMVDGVVILPGRNYKYSSASYKDSGNHLRFCSSTRLCIQPDPLKSGNISVDLSFRSHVVLNFEQTSASNTNIVEPFTVTANVVVAPRLFKIHPSNTNIGALDAPQEWSQISLATKNHLRDEFDASIIVATSSFQLNVSAPQLKEIQQILKHNSAPKHISTETRPKQQTHFSLCVRIPSISLSVHEVMDVTSFQTSLSINNVSIDLSSSHQTSLNISAGAVGTLFAEGSLTLPIFYTIDECQTQYSIAPSLHEVLVRAGKFYIVVIPSFVKHINRFVAAVKDKRRRKGSNTFSSQVKDNSMSLHEKIRQCRRSITLNVMSDGLNIVLPSQDIHNLFSSDSQAQLNSICLGWSSTEIVVSLEVSKLDDTRLSNRHDSQTEVKAKDELFRLLAYEGGTHAGNFLVSSKLDTSASFCFTRTLLTLRSQKQLDAQYVDLPYFQPIAEQCIISPVSYSFVTSHIMTTSSNDTPVCSLGIHLDVGDVGILWHITRSNFGFSDALNYSIKPLSKDKPEHHAIQIKHNFDVSSLQASYPIHYREQSEPSNARVMIPEKIRLFFKGSMVVLSIRIKSIQLTCVPGNAKDVQSPIMKLRVNTIRFGASIFNLPIFDIDQVDRSDDSSLSCSSWLDFGLSGHYHNRRLVLWEPLIEGWTGNLALNFNIGLQPFSVDHYTTDDLLEPSRSAIDVNGPAHFMEGINYPIRDKNEKFMREERPSLRGGSGIICHLIQCIKTREYLELALHPSADHRALHLRETFIHNELPLYEDTSVTLSLCSGKADRSSSNFRANALPLNINVTGALIENVGLVLSDRQRDSHIAPHYICNQTGLTMCLKVDNLEHLLANGERMELPDVVGFPKSSFVFIKLYKNKKSARLKAVRRVNVDLVGAKQYALRSLGNRAISSVIVRVRLIGTAKVVSVESPVWFLNASSTSFQLHLKDSDDKDIFSTAAPPRSHSHRNEIPQHAIPLPVDSIATINNDVFWYISITNIIPQHLHQLPIVSISRQGLFEEAPFSVPTSKSQKMSLNACQIRVASCRTRGAVQNNASGNPVQRAIILRPHYAFRNNLPNPISLELCTSSSKENTRTHPKKFRWVNMGEVKSGDMIEVPFASKDDDIEFRIKIVDDNNVFPLPSSSVHISPKSDAKHQPLHLTDNNGATVLVWAGIDINKGGKNDFLDQIKLCNSPSRVIFVYTPAILIDNTGQNLDVLNGKAVLCEHGNVAVSRFGGLSRTKVPTAAVYMVGGKSTHLAFRQREGQQMQTSSRWSGTIPIESNRNHNRIFVPRQFHPFSRPLILCAKTTDAPEMFGGKHTKVVSIENKYILLNLLPIAIEVISTNKSGSSQKLKPLTVGNTPTPLHFDDRGFVRLRPKEIGWTYSGLISITRSHGDVAIRLRNRLTGKALIITIEVNKISQLSVRVVIRRSRAVPFRIENLSTTPLIFEQQQSSIIRRIFKWSDSTVLLPYYQADYAWDELENGGKRSIAVAIADLDFGRHPNNSASLGHFYLDTLVPGSKADVSHNLFDVSVVADGPTRVLRFTDSSLSLSLPRKTSSNKPPHQMKVDLFLCIDVGISLVDWVPRELIYLSLNGLSISRHLSEEGDDMHFSIRRIAADCSIWATEYPVLFEVATDNRRKNAFSVSWSRDTNDILGKDITLLRHASIDMGKLICKVDGSALIRPLIQMTKTATKELLVYDGKYQEHSLNTDCIASGPQCISMEAGKMASNADESDIISRIVDPPSPAQNTFLDLTHAPKHKYYIEKLNISAVKAEFSYCGASPLPSWLSPAFMFETLPIRLPSFSCSYMYGSANEHVQRVRDHYNIWRFFLFGISLTPTFFARACLFTTKKSMLVIFGRASSVIRSFSQQVITGTNQSNIFNHDHSTSGGLRNTITSFLSRVRQMLLPFTYGILKSDARVRAPRLFIKQGDADVLVEYAEGEKSGEAQLSRIRSGRYMPEGYISHGDLHGIGEYYISPYDGSLFYILTQERLLVLKKTTDIPSIIWDLQLHNIVHCEIENLPTGMCSLQFFHMEHGNVEVGKLSSKLLLFNDYDTPRLALEFILSINKAIIQ